MNNLIYKARHLPVAPAHQTVSISPVTLKAPQRGQPLEMRITAPMHGRDLPIILLSHGDGPRSICRPRMAMPRWRISPPNRALP